MITASIVGATGYTGAVLTDILSAHPQARLGALTSQSYAGQRVSEVFPHLRVQSVYAEFSLEAVSKSDVVFVCYPHAQSYTVVAGLVDAGLRVIDLSADFRLRDPEAYSDWYGFVHPRADLVTEAVFGLPERYRAQIARARLVANPGCYPTSLLLAALPVADEIDPTGLIADSKSGVSGAGRTPTSKNHFCSVTANFSAYSEVGHRHTAEMLQEIRAAAGWPVPVSFTPQLLPVERGIFTTMYFRPKSGFIGNEGWLRRYREFYAGEPFVEVCEKVPALAEVTYTNYCRLAVREDPAGGVVKVFSVIDNLVKGASGQAVQNMNCMFGFPEQAGLLRRV